MSVQNRYSRQHCRITRGDPPGSDDRHRPETVSLQTAITAT